MRRAGFIAWLLVACRFDGGGLPVDDAAIQGPVDAPVDVVADALVDAPVDGPPDATLCPQDYEDLGVAGSKYRFVSPPAAWVDAEADCENDSATAHLVVLDNAAELAVIDPKSGGKAWIGFTDRVMENSFLNVTGGSTTFQPWQNGEPNDGGLEIGSEDCVELDGAEINDENCPLARSYVCECDAQPALRSAYTPP